MRAIAVLTCVYEGEIDSFFEEMLQSLFSANRTENVEIRLYLHVDGAVSSKKHDLIKKYPPYKVVYSEHNVGLAVGLNKLINVREDECYFFRMDSDDLIVADRFIKQIEFMDNNQVLDMSGSAISEFLDIPSNIVAKRTYPKSEEDIKRHMLKGSPFAHVTVCFRADFFTKFGFYPTNANLNEDIAYWYKSHRLGAVSSNLDDVLVLVRMDSAYNRRTFKKSVSELRVYLKIACWQKKLPLFALARFIFRLLPSPIVKYIYNSQLRNIFLT